MEAGVSRCTLSRANINSSMGIHEATRADNPGGGAVTESGDLSSSTNI